MDTVGWEICGGEAEGAVILEYMVVTTETVVSEVPKGGKSGISLQITRELE